MGVKERIKEMNVVVVALVIVATKLRVPSSDLVQGIHPSAGHALQGAMPVAFLTSSLDTHPFKRGTGQGGSERNQIIICFPTPALPAARWVKKKSWQVPGASRACSCSFVPDS